MTKNNPNILETKKKSETWALVKRLVHTYLRPYFKDLGFAMIFMAMAAAMTGAFAAMIQPVIDDALVAGDISRVWFLAFAIIVLFIIRGGATYIHTIMMTKIGQHIIADAQKDMVTNFMGLDLSFFFKNPSGTLIARVISDVDVMRGAVNEVLTGLGKSFLTFIFLAGVMFYQDWVLALAAFVIFPIAAVFIIWIGKRLRKQSRKIQMGRADLSHRLSQTFQGVRLVQAYGMEEAEIQRSSSVIEKVRDTIIKTVKIANLSTPVNEFLAGLVLFGIIIYGGHKVAADETSVGALMSFITAFIMSYEPLKKLAKLNNKLQMGLGAAERVFDMLDSKAAVQNIENAKVVKFNKPTIKFQNVDFEYVADEGKALDGIDLIIKSGKVTALVGSSGSGKTTIMNLIPRFFDVTAGEIFIEEKNIKEYALASLREQIALVSQDIMIFDDTVQANIGYGRAGASYEEIVAAAKAAEADEFIKAMPEGYDTRLGEDGVRLSGGQKQRIAIARALLRDAPILLLDEATSALDNESESAIQQTLQKLQHGRTTLVIAHRLSTVQNADTIYVLDNGHVAEQGQHQELIEREGVYARIYRAGLQE